MTTTEQKLFSFCVSFRKMFVSSLSFLFFLFLQNWVPPHNDHTSPWKTNINSKNKMDSETRIQRTTTKQANFVNVEKNLNKTRKVATSEQYGGSETTEPTDGLWNRWAVCRFAGLAKTSRVRDSESRARCFLLSFSFFLFLSFSLSGYTIN